MQTKICATCKIEKSADCFHKAKKEKDGLQYRCIECGKNYHAKRYLNRKEIVKAQVQTYRANNKDRLDAAGKIWRDNNKEKVKKYQKTTNLRKNFGLSIEDYERMSAEQNHACAICRLPETFVHPATKKPASLAVDHCHSSGKVRKLLCSSCNKGLGLFKDNQTFLSAAIAYLKEHNV